MIRRHGSVETQAPVWHSVPGGHTSVEHGDPASSPVSGMHASMRPVSRSARAHGGLKIVSGTQRGAPSWSWQVSPAPQATPPHTRARCRGRSSARPREKASDAETRTSPAAVPGRPTASTRTTVSARDPGTMPIRTGRRTFVPPTLPPVSPGTLATTW